MAFRFASMEILRRLLMVAILAGVFFLSATAVGYLSFRGHTIEVPNIIGRNETEAADELQGYGLRIKVTGRPFNDKVETSAIIDQAPAPGAIVKTGQIVRVSVSRGKQN